jgi:hypothetical protein
MPVVRIRIFVLPGIGRVGNIPETVLLSRFQLLFSGENRWFQ